ncbi:phosphatidate cytidylyltransferase, partial [Anaerotruncus colihominis]|uniref:phosphatidate cytidylyltransferase n=1 Tax=Anaerotruncus colihominis TaxID=169435 RepID=UPI00272F5F35
FSLTTVVYIRDRNGMWLGIFYVLMALGCAWLSDTGAYFAGRAFGKHKLAPYISPKKTVEGAVGGVIFA